MKLNKKNSNQQNVRGKEWKIHSSRKTDPPKTIFCQIGGNDQGFMKVLITVAPIKTLGHVSFRVYVKFKQEGTWGSTKTIHYVLKDLFSKRQENLIILLINRNNRS